MKTEAVSRGGTTALNTSLQSPHRDGKARQAPPRTSYQRREIQAAVNRERGRCAGIIQRYLRFVRPSLSVLDERRAVAEMLERIRQPWRVRVAARKRVVPGRLRRCCGICGADDHTAPRHRSEA